MPRLNPPIQALLDKLVDQADERGLQVAAYHHGELVVDAFAGVADVNTGAHVDADTLFPVFSVTKALAATAIHLLAERKQLEYDATVASYWPEFAANGKEGITVRQILGHTAGLYKMPDGLDHTKLASWDYMVDALAKETPAYTPGEQQIYHAITYGWLTGELIRRIDGRAFPQFLEEEIKAPLGIEAMYCAIPEGVESRIAWLEEDNPSSPDNLANGSVPGWVRPLHVWMNRDDARRACIPASSGIMNARSIARHFAALLPGGVDGVSLLPESRITTATERQWPTTARENALNFGLGYALGTEDSATGSHGFGHGGYGGSHAFADPATGLAFALCKNRFNDQDNTRKVIDKVRELIAD